jgi:TolB-like protein/ketosteroid isomerase-like protein
MRDETAKVVPIRAVEPASPPPARLPAEPRRMPRWPWLVVAVAVLLALAARYGREWLGPTGPVTVGVMDVRARTGAVPDWMRTLTRDSLNTVLARLPDVQVFSRQKIEFLREKRGLTEIEAAEALGMRKLLGASVGLDAGQVTLEVEVVDIASGMLEDTARVQGPEAALLDLQTELALRVLTALGVTPSEDDLRAIVAERRDATVEAYRLLSETLGGGKPRGGSAAPPATTPPTPGPGPGSSWLVPGARAWAQAPEHEEAAIHDLLRRYALALQSKQAEALAALQVEMDDAQRASLDRYFAIAKELVVEVREIDVLVDGPDAVVTFTREDTFVDAPSGRSMRLKVRVSGRLVKRDGDWKIHHLGDPS